MKDIIWILIGILVAFAIAMLIEDSRDWLSEAWDYLISFEWLGDIWEFISDMFTNLDEFSVGGLGFGISSCLLIFFLSDWMLKPFLEYMNPFGKVFWTVLTYIGCFVVGYLLGKKIFDD
jgi:MFS superfamily sulfate permease-like transporter